VSAAFAALLAVLLAVAVPAFAGTQVESMTGDVRVGQGPATPGADIPPGTTVVLGSEAKATLRFDDGMRVVLDRNTTFRIADFSYAADDPGKDRAVFDLTRGAMRMVTGVLGKRSPQALAMRAPHATIQVRGTDYMMALVNPAYLEVLSGSIAAINGAGTVVFGQKAFGEIAGPDALAVPASESAVPPNAMGAFARLLEGLDPVAAVLPADGSAAGAAAAAAAEPTNPAAAAILLGVGAAAIWVLTNPQSTTSH
jgi:hypothetical protein